MNILNGISVLECICVDGVKLSNFGGSLQEFKPDMTHVTSCRSVFRIKRSASAVFNAFSLDLPFRETKNFIWFS